ncbi:MAG: hypothetical protein AB8I08_06235 [Sandaracinaceae bacterium]
MVQSPARRLLALFASLTLSACTTSTLIPDASVDGSASDAALRDGSAADANLDAGPANPLCGCTSGLHASHIFLLGDDGELYTYEPLTDTFEFRLGPVCADTGRPFSMAVDPAGRAWIQESESRRLARIDVNDLGACEDSGYLPTNPTFPLFGMSFVQQGACASLYGLSYSGDGPFAEGPDLGEFGVVEGEPPRMRSLAALDYDGGELAGTGDGRLFAFTGVDPAKIVELDPATGAVLEVVPLDGVSKTNASAFAFFGGDIYLFTEAVPDACEPCFESMCGEGWTACQADDACESQVRCAIETGTVSDACGGGAGEPMLSCMNACDTACFVRPAARVSQVLRIDWDESEGSGRQITQVRNESPLRVVGAGTSPCVPTVPF